MSDLKVCNGDHEFGELQLAMSVARHVGPVRSVAFSPDGATLATGGRDGTVVLWDLGTAKNEPLSRAIAVP